MIEIPFDPVLALGPLRVSWHSLFSLVGIVVGAAVTIRVGRRWFSFDQGWAASLGGVAGGLVGARAFHVLDSWPQYAADPLQVLAVWNGGVSIVGGIVGGFVGIAWIARRVHIRLGHILDAGTVGLGFGMAIGRLGDIVSGEHHASACSGLPWCVRYTNANTLGQTTPVHPAVGYEMLWDLVAVSVVLWVFPRATALGLGGRLFFVFIALYGAGRLVLSTTRLDPALLFGLQAAQLASIAFIAAGAAALVTREPGGRRGR